MGKKSQQARTTVSVVGQEPPKPAVAPAPAAATTGESVFSPDLSGDPPPIPAAPPAQTTNKRSLRDQAQQTVARITKRVSRFARFIRTAGVTGAADACDLAVAQLDNAADVIAALPVEWKPEKRGPQNAGVSRAVAIGAKLSLNPKYRAQFTGLCTPDECDSLTVVSINAQRRAVVETPKGIRFIVYAGYLRAPAASAPAATA